MEHELQGLPWEARDLLGARSGVVATSKTCCFAANFVAGGMSLPLAVAAVHPLDTVRTAMQAALTGNRTFSEVARGLGWQGFTRGFSMSILWASPQGAIRFGCYESFKGSLLEQFDARPLGVAVSAIAADFASSVVKVPRELITQRMQTDGSMSSTATARAIIREDGVRGLFRGYVATCLRDAPFVVLLFFSYEQFKVWKIRLTFASQRPAQVLSPMSDLETVLWGGISGGMAGFFTTPFDVVKTRIMTSKGISSIGDVVRTAGGPQGLFVGAGARSAWWFCVCSVFFPTYERLRVILHDRLGAPQV